MGVNPGLRVVMTLGRRARLIVALGLVAAAMAGCGGTSTSTGKAAGSQRSSDNKCRLVRHEIFNGGIEREPLVACSAPHNVEVVGTWPLYGKATHAAIVQYNTHCTLDLESSLHLRDGAVFRPVVVAVGVPMGRGHYRVQCEAWLLPGIGAYRDRPATVTTTSLADEAKRGDSAGTDMCTNSVPTAAGSLFVDCSKPHLAQAIEFTLHIAAKGGTYPTTATRSRGQLLCRQRVNRLPDARRLTTYAWYWTKSLWDSNGKPAYVPGMCWYFRKDHRDLPAVS